MATPYCTDCQRNMEGGFLTDTNQGFTEIAKWIEGPAEKSFWGGMKIKGRRNLPVYAWRCPGCSLVRLYPPEG
ncbi:MAG TPA: hypothetical protein VHG93_25585 [Longimicrobium sp.]|nr:hypothetical protein [Longimicrobium sp.]